MQLCSKTGLQYRQLRDIGVVFFFIVFIYTLLENALHCRCKSSVLNITFYVFTRVFNRFTI